jgi:hypothetical protein
VADPDVAPFEPPWHRCISYQPPQDVELHTIAARRMRSSAPPGLASTRLEGLAAVGAEHAAASRRAALGR